MTVPRHLLVSAIPQLVLMELRCVLSFVKDQY